MNPLRRLRSGLSDAIPILYQREKYLGVHNHSCLKKIESNGFMMSVVINEGVATCIPKSPFGGIICLEPGRKTDDFKVFMKHIAEQLQDLNVTKLIVHQPPPYYSDFVPEDWLLNAGFTVSTNEINQYLKINEPIEQQMHLMERRKLKHRTQYKLLKTGNDRLQEVHAFISECRKYQGLEINITLDKLRKLFEAFPAEYELFEATFHEQIVSAVIAVNPTHDIAYYYLPATLPEHKPYSPMVSLMAYMYEYYQQRGFKYFDLGISSVGGQVQSNLFTFKQRMGAFSGKKTTFEYQL